MKKGYLLFLICILFLPFIVNAETVQTGKFSYMPAYEEETKEVYYYSDEYFKKSGKIDNEHLLAMSFNLAISTFEIRGYSFSSSLLKDIGFKDFKAYEMEEKPSVNTIGTVIAHKKVDGKNLIAVAVRGEKYDSEWGNNFIVGKTGNAKGFDDSSIKVINRIKEYIKDNNLNNNKIWIVGYSRGGTVSDLTGVYINNHLNEFKTTADDLYVYTFEAPAASVDETIYDNIYTIRNKNDLIPQVYPESWGFHTNGKITIIGDNQTVPTYKGLLSQEEIGSVDTNTFLNDFFTWLPSRLTREEYASQIEEPASKLLDIYYSKNDEDREKLLNFLTNELKTEVVDTTGTVFLDIFERNSDSIYKNISKKVVESIERLENSDNAKVLSAEELQTIKSSIYPILRALGPVIVDDYYYFDGIDYDSYYGKYYPQFVLEEADYAYEIGKDKGFNRGYTDAEYDEPRDNTVPDWFFEEDDTNIYINNFTRGFQETYDDGYELGLSHKNNYEAKGRYEGYNAGKEIGYRAGANGEANTPNPEDYYSDLYWIGTETVCDEEDEECETEKVYTEEDLENLEKYKTSYYAGYEEGWNEGYPEGQKEEPNRGMELSMYHLATILKNFETFKSNHFPQNNLGLIHALDSYYAPYDLTEGANQTIINNDEEKDSLTFKTSGHLEKLIKVQVDGKDLKNSDFESKSGSTIVTLKDSFLKTLSAGTHTLKMIYIDNEIETTFTIEKIEKSSSQTLSNNDKENPSTGDDINIYISILVLSLLGSIMSIIYLKQLILNRN